MEEIFKYKEAEENFKKILERLNLKREGLNKELSESEIKKAFSAEAKEFYKVGGLTKSELNKLERHARNMAKAKK